jgi:hypothetical protein
MNLFVGYVIVPICGFDSLDHIILLFSVVVDDEIEFILFVVIITDGMLYFVLCYLNHIFQPGTQ